jgi:hypothetical protein
MSEQEVKLAFAKEAAAEAAKDSATIHADMHPSELIAQGLQLEDQQYVILIPSLPYINTN